MEQDQNKQIEPGNELDYEETQGEDSLGREFFTFLMENKIWWITPAVLILLLVVGFFIWTKVSGDDSVAPFIYTLF